MPVTTAPEDEREVAPGDLGRVSGKLTPYAVEQAQDVLTIRMTEVREGWEQWFLLASDVHWDNPHCNRALFHRHMRQAKERRAGVFIFGDFFCLMQGRGDPRGNKDSIRPEHNTATYIDSVVDTAAVDLEPYADIIELLGYGNHETSVLKHQETDVIARLGKRLGVAVGGYSGFIRFLFSRGKSNKSSLVLFYHHGSGGGGPVTKGVIRTNRQAVWLPDAQIVVGGHVHQDWVLTLPRVRIGHNGTVYRDEQTHTQLGTYKDEMVLSGGFHTERGREPRPLGGAWLRFYYDSNARLNVNYEIIRAK